MKLEKGMSLEVSPFRLIRNDTTRSLNSTSILCYQVLEDESESRFIKIVGNVKTACPKSKARASYSKNLYSVNDFPADSLCISPAKNIRIPKEFNLNGDEIPGSRNETMPGFLKAVFIDYYGKEKLLKAIGLLVTENNIKIIAEQTNLPLELIVILRDEHQSPSLNIEK
jgi:hypothetical protein